MPVPALLRRLRRRAMRARTGRLRAFWKRALLRNRRRYLAQTVAFDGVPTQRGLALLLQHARDHGWKGQLNSSDRRKGIAERYGHQSQWALYDGWQHRRPGYLPANPPGHSSHELRSDGNPVFRKPSGGRLAWWFMGLDVGDDQTLVTVLQAAGVDIRHPYQTLAEAHHVNVLADPTQALVALGLA